MEPFNEWFKSLFEFTARRHGDGQSETPRPKTIGNLPNEGGRLAYHRGASLAGEHQQHGAGCKTERVGKDGTFEHRCSE